MIPKIIHYCWFGGKPLPRLASKCILSWKKYLPDYEIKEWNETNFDVNAIPFTAEAYKAKKYAFVSDYVRFYVLYKYGGLYFDTDVEIINSMNDIIANGPFMGCEKNGNSTQIASVAPGLGLGAVPLMPIYKEILDEYEKRAFTNSKGTDLFDTVVTFTTSILKKYGLSEVNTITTVAGINLYPVDYFCPKREENGHFVLKITNNTVSIHHYDASWIPLYQRYLIRAKVIIGNVIGFERLYYFLNISGLMKIRHFLMNNSDEKSFIK